MHTHKNGNALNLTGREKTLKIKRLAKKSLNKTSKINCQKMDSSLYNQAEAVVEVSRGLASWRSMRTGRITVYSTQEKKTIYCSKLFKSVARKWLVLYTLRLTRWGRGRGFARSGSMEKQENRQGHDVRIERETLLIATFCFVFFALGKKQNAVEIWVCPNNV